jgi:hypothetical protein
MSEDEKLGFINVKKIETLLRMDFWKASSIPYILADIDFTQSRQLDDEMSGKTNIFETQDRVFLWDLSGNRYECLEDAGYFRRYIALEQLNEIWAASVHPEEYAEYREINFETHLTYPVHYVINWALKKKIHIPWYQWALDNDLLFAIKPNQARTSNTDAEIAPKTKNTMLRTIRALAEVAAGGLTDKFSKDAQACIAAMENKGLTPPIETRKLSDYLKEAKNLEK